MIYLFDRQKKLQKILPRKNIISAIQTVELNALYTVSVEVPLFYESKEGTQYNHKKNVEKAWFAGHYDKQGRFQLYKIHTRKVNASNKRIMLFDGVHIFFDEAKAMGNIHDRRFRDSEAKPAADAAFNPIGWTIRDYDVTDRADINFYRSTVSDARKDIIDTYGVEFDYGLQFDGRKIISKDIYMKNRIGQWTGKRFAYGTNLMSLSEEQNESEIYTAAVGRGRGEEAGEGHGPRLEFNDIEWSKDGIEKPSGQNWIEIPSATQEYGFYEDGEIKPRFAPEVVFENVEDPYLLADKTYSWLLENCVPKAVWETDVARIGDVDLGDGVAVIYKKAGIIKTARIQKMENNLLDHNQSKATLGDYGHFKTDRRQQRVDSEIQKTRRDNQSYITQMKNDFDARFDAQTTAIDNAYQQAVTDAHAEIDAAETRMRTDFNNDWDSMETDFKSDVQDARDYAETQAQNKANDVQGNLDRFKSEHHQMYDDVVNDVQTIDEFLGDKSETLSEQFASVEKKHQELLSGLSTAQMDIQTNSDGISGLLTNLSTTDDKLSSLTTDFKIEAGRIETLMSKTDGHETKIGNIIASYDEMSSTIATLNDDLSNQGTILQQLDDTITSKVWMNDISEVGANLIPQSANAWEDGSRWSSGSFDNNSRGIRLKEDEAIPITDGKTYTWQDDSDYVSAVHTWQIHCFDDSGNMVYYFSRPRGTSNTFTAQGTHLIISAVPMEGFSVPPHFIQHEDNRIKMKLEAGDTATPMMNFMTRFQQQADSVTIDVQNTKLGGVNLIPDTDFSLSSNPPTSWSVWGSSSDAYINNVTKNTRLLLQTANPPDTTGTPAIGLLSPEMVKPLTEGKTYNITWLARTSTSFGSTFRYMYLIDTEDGNKHLSNTVEIIETGVEIQNSSATYTRYKIIFESPVSGTAKVLFGGYYTGGKYAYIYLSQPQLEEGNTHTPWSPAPDDVVKHSEIDVTPDYVQLGSKQLGDDEFASIFRVSPKTIDVITEEMRISGDMAVAGDIESISMSAMEGEFARLWAAEFDATTITTDHILGLTAEFERMYLLNANIERLMAQHVFINESKVISLDAVYANISEIFSEMITANVIEAEHIKVDANIINKLFANDALIGQLTGKNAFIRDIQAIEITVNQLNINTLLNEMGQVEGGISIRRPDGAYYIENGQARGHVPVQVQDSYGSEEVGFTGLNFYTGSSHWRTFKYFYTPHEGTRLRIVWACNIYDGPSNVEFMEVRVRTFSAYSPINMGNGTSARRVTIQTGETTYVTQDIPMPPPNYNMTSAYLDFRRAPDGQSINNRVSVRLLHIGQYD